jgi:hypothetical protein
MGLGKMAVRRKMLTLASTVVGVISPLALSSNTASGAIITSSTDGVPVVSDTLPTATLGSQGYILYGGVAAASAAPYSVTNGNIVSTGTETSPVSYVQANAINSGNILAYNGTGVSTTETIDGVDYRTGQLYNVNGSNPGAHTPETLVTLTLTETGVNGSTTSGASVAPFTLGVLEDNWADSGNNDMESVTVTLAGDSDNATLLQSVIGNATISNDFYLYTISGAHVGDTITIAPASANDGENITLGGLTFDAAVPEPTGIITVLAVTGISALRRRRA